MPERKSAEELEAETCSGNTRSFVRPVKRVTRPQVYPQERLRIVLEGFRGEVRVSELCRRGSIARALEGRVGFEATTPGSKVRDPSDE
jgi:hypothetical protein